MTTKKETHGDFAAQIAEVKKAIDKVNTPELRAMHQLLQKLLPSIREQDYRRFPVGLIEEPDENGVIKCQIEPQLPCRPTHLVLAPETAHGYDLNGIFVGPDL